MDEIATKLLQSRLPGFSEKFPQSILAAEESHGDLTVVLRPEAIRDCLSYLKRDPNLRFDMLVDLFAIDYMGFEPEQPGRFAVVYHLLSLFQKGRVTLKVFLQESSAEVDSVHDLYQAANWFEREAWDLYGIKFSNHPGLIRILCHDEFEGHPLRKDYPSDKYQRLKNTLPSTGL